MIKQLEEEIIRNINNIPQVPLSMFLSGGIDSSLVLALVRKVYPQLPIFTFSLARSNTYPDIIFARKIAKRFKTEHTELILSENEYREYLKKYNRIKKYDFKGDVNIFILCSMAKNFSKQIITGDGGDECFGGYWLHKYPLGHKESGAIKSFVEIHPSPKKHIEEMVKLGYRGFYYKENPTTSDYDAVWEYFIEIMAPRHLAPLRHISNALNVTTHTPLFSENLVNSMRLLPYQERIDRKIERDLAVKYLPKTIIERKSIGFDLALEKKSFYDLI